MTQTATKGLSGKELTKWQKMVRGAVSSVVPNQERDTGDTVADDYASNYNCRPPPLFMIFISLIEVSKDILGIQKGLLYIRNRLKLIQLIYEVSGSQKRQIGFWSIWTHTWHFWLRYYVGKQDNLSWMWDEAQHQLVSPRMLPWMIWTLLSSTRYEPWFYLSLKEHDVASIIG